jgi:hypothetical protein
MSFRCEHAFQRTVVASPTAGRTMNLFKVMVDVNEQSSHCRNTAIFAIPAFLPIHSSYEQIVTIHFGHYSQALIDLFLSLFIPCRELPPQ